MLMAQGEPMGAVGPGSTVQNREGDPQASVLRLLAHLASGLDQMRDPAQTLRVRLEDGLRSLLPTRTVRVRESGAPETRTDLPSPGAVVIRIPISHPGRSVSLEVCVDGGGDLDRPESQALQAAAQLAALVFEVKPRKAVSPSDPSSRPCRGRAPVMVGSSPIMRAVHERMARVAVSDVTVVIEGETGSGKELVARGIHELSHRRYGPFVPINCAALVETLVEVELFGIEDRTATGVRGRRGKFEHADGGTLFLDEISDLSPTAQAKLLRALQDLAVERVGGMGAHPVDTRVIVATNRSLRDMVRTGNFRSDLFYRVNGVDIYVPPLRARTEDMTELAACFLRRYAPQRTLRISESAVEAMRAYPWPGNVRELEHTMERAAALMTTDEVALGDLPPAVAREYATVLLPSVTRGDSMRAWGSRYARLVLARCGHNKRQACDVLDISYHTLQAYLRYGTTTPPGGVPAETSFEQSVRLSAPTAGHASVERRSM